MPALPSLGTLDLWAAASLRSLAGLPALPAVERVVLRGAAIATLAGLPGVRDLAIGGTAIASLDEVPDTVERLDLRPPSGMPSPIRSLAGIERLPRLRRLDLRGTGITDLAPLAGRDPMPRVVRGRQVGRR
jgi:hypothetical protein